jgi:hypothetical protein
MGVQALNYSQEKVWSPALDLATSLFKKISGFAMLSGDHDTK